MMDYTLTFLLTVEDETDGKLRHVPISARSDADAFGKAQTHLKEQYPKGKTLVRPFYPQLVQGERLVASVAENPATWFELLMTTA